MLESVISSCYAILNFNKTLTLFIGLEPILLLSNFAMSILDITYKCHIFYANYQCGLIIAFNIPKNVFIINILNTRISSTHS